MLNMFVTVHRSVGVNKTTVNKFDEDGVVLAKFDEEKGKISFGVLENREGQEITIHYSDEKESKIWKIKSCIDGKLEFEDENRGI